MNAHSNKEYQVLPHNIEAEQQLLGQILLNNNCYYAVNKMMKPEYFYEQLHQNLYQTAADLIETGKKCNPITIKNYLPEDSKVGDITLSEYMARLASSVVGLAPVDSAQAIIELYSRRRLIDACRIIEEKTAFPDPQTSLESIVGELEGEMNQMHILMRESKGDAFISLHDALHDNLDHIAKAYQGGDPVGYDTGLEFMNDLVGPFIPGQYIIIGAATKTGKSALAMQIAERISWNHPVLYFSIEMNANLLAARKMASETSISTRRQRTGKVNEKDFELLSRIAASEGSRNLLISSEKLSIEEVFDVARRYKRLNGRIGAVVVDHLGIMAKSKSMRTGSDWEIAAHASPVMKDIAEELDCVSIGLSQLNKEDQGFGLKTIEAKINACLRKPNFNNLKGAIANDADHVIMPFRAQAALSKLEPAKNTEDWQTWNVAMEEHQGRGQIVLALSRESNWPKTVDVKWDGTRTSFETIIEEQHSFGEAF